MAANEKKTKKLGMNPGTASARLKKSIMFDLASQLDLTWCYRCGARIETPAEFSIEHKISWLDSDNPNKLFFDLDNIAFSHLSCNCADGRKNAYIKQQEQADERAKKILDAGNMICVRCGNDKPLSDFKVKSNSRLGCETTCKKCNAEKKAEYDKRNK